MMRESYQFYNKEAKIRDKSAKININRAVQYIYFLIVIFWTPDLFFNTLSPPGLGSIALNQVLTRIDPSYFNPIDDCVAGTHNVL